MIHGAKWICHPSDGREARLVPVFCRRFEVTKELKSATLAITAHGLYEARLNGKTVTDNRFMPGLTSYYHRIQVQEYDVTELLCPGENIWTTTVGDGWWRWNYNFGPRVALLGALTLEYVDGSREIIATDESFEVSTGSIVKTDLKAGETYDARIVPQNWVPVKLETAHTDAALIPTVGVPVREQERFPGIFLRDAAGNLVVDFGQNLAGFVRMKLYNTKPGQVVHLKHGEALDLEGKFSTANCDGGETNFQEITYICKGGEVEEYQPHFAFFGFRYALVEGIEDADFTAIAVYSDMAPAGEFECSDPLINKLVENARWSQKGNFLDVAVDCPTRERNAWTGDAQIYCRTAAWFMDVEAFFEKWLKDMTVEQYADGKIANTFPNTALVHDPQEWARVNALRPELGMAGPDGTGYVGDESAGWGDAAVWIPYQMYLMYGNRTILENQYETAKRWVDYTLRCMKDKSEYHTDKPWYANGDGDYIYDTKFHYGEWCEPLPPDPDVIQLFMNGGTTADYGALVARKGKPEVATAYTKRSCDNLSHIAQILGRAEDAAYYREEARKIKSCYDKYMVAENGEIQPGHQAAYVRALALDMVGKAKRPLVIQQLVKEIENANYHLNTGFLSTVYLLPTLCDIGRSDLAYKLLQQEELPGWLHCVKMGATTMLENWDGMDKFRDSFNHYSFGTVCQFLFEYVAGIRPTFDGPGFQEIELKPVPGGTLTWAKASYQTKFGKIESRWEIKDGMFTYHCVVPKGANAKLTLPDGTVHTLSGSSYDFTCNGGR